MAYTTKGPIIKSTTFFHPPTSVAARPLLLLELPFSIAVISFSFLNFHLLPLIYKPTTLARIECEKRKKSNESTRRWMKVPAGG